MKINYGEDFYMYNVIAIEREYGSGGHEIAEKLAKRLGFELYDRSVVVETCKRLGIPYEQVSAMDEQNPVNTFFKPSKDSMTLEEKIYNTEKEIILEAAERTKCVFVGRAACEILKDQEVLKVFITADKDFRLDRTVNVENISPSEAEDVMKKFDKKREKFFASHSEGSWGARNYFDIILNSGHIGINTCVDVLEALAK